MMIRTPTSVPDQDTGLAIRGHEGLARVYLWEITTADKDYKCWLCGGGIPKETPHTFFRFLFRDKKGYDHHHIHNQCAAEKVLPHMTGVETIPYSKVPLKSRWRPRR